MTQQYMGQIPDPSKVSGTDLAAMWNAFDNAHRTNQAGPTRPAGILAGGFWSKVVEGVYDAMLFDGAQDRVLMTGEDNLAGLTNKELARTNLGLKALATKDKAAIVNDTTGTLPVNRGGTGGTTEAAARAGIGISAAATITTRLNAAVAHSDAAWEAGESNVAGLPSPRQMNSAGGGLARDIAKGGLGAPRISPKALSSNLLLYAVSSTGAPAGVSDIGWVKTIRLGLYTGIAASYRTLLGII